jgi:quercetin dioxygenase-like cupin family protein
MSKNSSGSFVVHAGLPREVLGDGVVRVMLGYDAELMMTSVTFQQRGVGALHQHPHRQVTYVASGKFEVQVGSEKNVLAQGDSFFVPPNIQHAVLSLEAGTLVDVFSPARDDITR